MKKLLICLTWLLMISCAGRKAVGNENTSRLEGRWLLTLFAYGGKDFAEMFAHRRPELVFEPANERVSGNTGCNRLTGTYSVNGDSFHFGPNMAVTKMACPNFDENEFLAAMTNINRYQLENKQLQLYNDSTLVMVFTKSDWK